MTLLSTSRLARLLDRTTMLIGAAIVAAFLADTMLPLGVLNGMLYVFIILIASDRSPRYVVCLAIICTILAGADYAIVHTESIEGMVLNRVFSVMALWALALAIVRIRAVAPVDLVSPTMLRDDSLDDELAVEHPSGHGDGWQVAPESLDEFQQAIVASGLMGIRDLQDVVSQLAASEAPCDATLLARELIERGLLTKFQVNKIFHNVADQLAFGRYRLVEPVGRGGFGSVYRGLDTATGEAVALKLLGMRRKDAEHAVVRFQREIATTLSLAHSHIVRSLDAGYHNRQLYLVMELVDGLNLHQLVSRSGPLDTATAIEYARQAAVGLAFAHSQGVIHRDVKPSNLLLEPSGRIKVGDFGLARRIDALGWGDGESMVTLTGMVIGSVDFIAPEQAVDFKRADERSDVYGLGCTLLFLLTGKTRFTGQTTEEKMARLRSPVGEPPVDLTALRLEIPKPLEKLFPQLIAWNPEKRLASMNVVAKRLTEIVAELAVTDLRSTGRRAV